MRLALCLIVACLALGAPPARADALSQALSEARVLFERAAPELGREALGVDIEAYREALLRGRFLSSHWGGTIDVEMVTDADPAERCMRFAAYALLPSRNGTIRLVICPGFHAPGAETLRRLTILHEFVHVVAGPDECRAMAFAAHVEQIAQGTHTPVDTYWQANGCRGSTFHLP